MIDMLLRLIAGMYFIWDGIRSYVKFNKQSSVNHIPRGIRAIVGGIFLSFPTVPLWSVLWGIGDGIGSWRMFPNQCRREQVYRFIRSGLAIALILPLPI